MSTTPKASTKVTFSTPFPNRPKLVINDVSPISSDKSVNSNTIESVPKAASRKPSCVKRKIRDVEESNQCSTQSVPEPSSLVDLQIASSDDEGELLLPKKKSTKTGPAKTAVKGKPTKIPKLKTNTKSDLLTKVPINVPSLVSNEANNEAKECLDSAPMKTTVQRKRKKTLKVEEKENLVGKEKVTNAAISSNTASLKLVVNKINVKHTEDATFIINTNKQNAVSECKRTIVKDVSSCSKDVMILESNNKNTDDAVDKLEKLKENKMNVTRNICVDVAETQNAVLSTNKIKSDVPKDIPIVKDANVIDSASQKVFVVDDVKQIADQDGASPGNEELQNPEILNAKGGMDRISGADYTTKKKGKTFM